MRGHHILFGLFILVMGLSCHHLIPLEPKDSSLPFPENIFPASDTTDTPVNITFIWSGCNTGNQDSLFYDFYLNAGEPGPEVIASNITDTSYQYNSLKYNTLYFWQVVARNQKGDSSSSPVWSFSTRYEYNNPPNTPNNPHPENGINSLAIQNSILSWSGGDVDSFSVVTYNVYFGKSVDSLSLISEDQADTFLTINDLEFSSHYFWKVAAKDHYGLISGGPVWNFSTESANLIFEENFDAYPTGGYPDPAIWKISKSGANLFITDSTAWNFNGKSVCLVDSAEIGNCYLATRLPARSVGTLEFCWRVTSNKDVFGVRLYSQQAQNERLGPQLSIRNGQLQYYDSSYNWQSICQIDSNAWYQIKLDYNCCHNFYKIFVNDEIKVDKATWTGSVVPNLDMIYFITFDNRVCQRAFLDEIKFFAGSSHK
jgi:hypothetical protein